MTELRVSLIQTDLIWQQPQANRDALSQKISALQGKTDLIVLPEMFTTGFSMQPEKHAESPELSETITWLQAQAHILGAAITGSVAMKLPIDEQGKHNPLASYVNRLLFVTPEGQVDWYDKKHLFRMANEHQHYQAGQQRKIIEWRGWRILPMICYDLRFPVFSRNKNDYDLALYLANWPAPRRQPWRTLLQARAIENQSFVLGVNRVGSDGSGLEYSGDSLVADFKGDLLLDKKPYQPFIDTTKLDLKSLQDFREKFPAWQDADDFLLV